MSYMRNYDSLILKVLVNGKGLIRKNVNRLNVYSNIYSYLMTRYADSESIEETIRRMKLGIEAKPLCPICGNPVSFIGKNTKLFTKYCSNSCRAKDISGNIWLASQKKYNLEHYGTESNFAVPNVIDKRKNTLLDRYNTLNLYEVDDIREKIRASVSKKIDVMLDNHDKSIRDKYGCGFSELLKLPEIQEKRNETMRKNNTYGKSKQEDIVYALLVERFGNVIRQYRSDVYPFNCDFYVPALDLYIEYQGSQYHNRKPYDAEEDAEELKMLIEKANSSKRHKAGKKSQYDMILYTWTELDPKKRKIAKENNLNWIEFFDIESLKLWLNNYYI